MPVKTTIELPDDLAYEAKRIAAESGTTLRSIVEEALRRELARMSERPAWQPDRDLTFGGSGLTPEARAMTWAQIRDVAMSR